MDTQQKIDGTLMQAFLAAHKAFKAIRDLSDQKKRLVNYEVAFSKDRNNFYVDFLPKRSQKDMQRRGGETSLGRALRFTVRSLDFQVTDVRRWR